MQNFCIYSHFWHDSSSNTAQKDLRFLSTRRARNVKLLKTRFQPTAETPRDFQHTDEGKFTFSSYSAVISVTARTFRSYVTAGHFRSYVTAVHFRSYYYCRNITSSYWKWWTKGWSHDFCGIENQSSFVCWRSMQPNIKVWLLSRISFFAFNIRTPLIDNLRGLHERSSHFLCIMHAQQCYFSRRQQWQWQHEAEH